MATSLIDGLLSDLETGTRTDDEVSRLLMQQLQLDIIVTPMVAADKSTIMHLKRTRADEPNDIGLLFDPERKKEKLDE